jgi:hypothetical protein
MHLINVISIKQTFRKQPVSIFRCNTETLTKSTVLALIARFGLQYRNNLFNSVILEPESFKFYSTTNVDGNVSRSAMRRLIVTLIVMFV